MKENIAPATPDFISINSFSILVLIYYPTHDNYFYKASFILLFEPFPIAALLMSHSRIYDYPYSRTNNIILSHKWGRDYFYKLLRRHLFAVLRYKQKQQFLLIIPHLKSPKKPKSKVYDCIHFF